MRNIFNGRGKIAKRAIERQKEFGAIVLDVRTTDEWNSGHVKGALWWGLEEKIRRGEHLDVSKNSEIFVYCRSGQRASEAMDILTHAGYINLTNIGCLGDWEKAGGDVE